MASLVKGSLERNEVLFGNIIQKAMLWIQIHINLAVFDFCTFVIVGMFIDRWLLGYLLLSIF